jgi:hypothetical protein
MKGRTLFTPRPGRACAAFLAASWAIAAPASAQVATAPTPPPAAEPLVPDWAWMLLLAVAILAALLLYMRRRR